MSEGERVAQEVMEHVRALRQELLTGGAQPDEDRRRSGLTAPQVDVLATLVRGGPATVTELAVALHYSHSTTSGIVDRLQARGLVERTRDTADGRRTRVSVTAPVREYVGSIATGPYGRLVAALDAASPQDRDAVLRGLGLLRTLLGTAPTRGDAAGHGDRAAALGS